MSRMDRLVSFPEAERAVARSWRLFVLAAALVTSSCGGGPPYVWYTTLPRTEWGERAPEYIIGVGDVLNIRVYEQEALSTTLKVRTDGRIALTLLGELVVVGMHPADLARTIETRLKQFIVSPRVTVNVDTAQPVTVNVLGEVANKGTITLEPPAHLLQALALCGGLTEFADDTRIFVLRKTPTFMRIRFSYDAIVGNENGAALFPLRTGDVILVE